MNFQIKLSDLVSLTPDPLLTKLTDKQKYKLIDQSLSGETGRKGLGVTISLTNSGKVTNGRIYLPKQVKDSIPSWTEPFQRPLLKHHNSESEPLGRITNVSWVNLDNQAMNVFDRLTSYTDVLRVLDSSNPQAIYKAMAKHGLLTNDKWQGVGKLRATINVTDKDAIEKFLDGRYQTFSWNCSTDALTCMVCGSEWHKGKICEHNMGVVDEEGQLGVFMTGKLTGREVSMVNDPGNIFSVVEEIHFGDSENEENIKPFIEKLAKASAEIVLSDSQMSFGVPVPTIDLSDFHQIEPAVFLQSIEDKTLGFDFDEAVLTAQDSDKEWLTKIADAILANGKEISATLKKALGQTEISDVQADAPSADEAPKEEQKEEAGQEAGQEIQVGDAVETASPLTLESIRELIDQAIQAALKPAEVSNAEEVKCSGDCKSCKCKDYDQLTEDYGQALKQIEELNTKLLDVLSKHLEEDLSDSEKTNTEKLVILMDKFVTIDVKQKETTEAVVKTLAPIENPSASSGELVLKLADKQLGEFEKSFVLQYNKLLDTQGEASALKYFRQNRKYLPAGFNLSKVIN